MPKNLTALFSPKSIAIVGASRSPQKVGSVVLKNILDWKFKGNIYPVNPNAKNIFRKKCYKSISELPEVVDLIIISIPASAVCEVLTQAGEKGIKNAVIISAGFKEVGETGKKLEEQIESVAKNFNINILGPNCLGFVNKSESLNATFGNVSSLNGNLRFITQSGAIATSIFDWCDSTQLGFNEFITLGNKTDINENDILEYFFDKTHNNVTSLLDTQEILHPIGLYLESIVDGKSFLQITKQITQHDPIFILKPGKTKEAASAMQSHTGAIAGADDVLDAALDLSGVVRCETLEDFFDLSKAFSWGVIPKGPKVAIISNAGGPAVVSADCVIKEGLELASFDEKTKEKLSQILPRSAAISDPIDVLGDALADRYALALETILETNVCDSVVVILTPQMMTQIKQTAQLIGNISQKYKKPIFCSFIGGKAVSEGEKILNTLQIPSFRFPERAIYALGTMWKYEKLKQRNKSASMDINQVLNTEITPEKVNEIIKNSREEKRLALNNFEANDLISCVGIKTPATSQIKNVEEAMEFIKENDYPVVLKLSSSQVLHKKKQNGIFLDINNKKQLESAWKSIQQSAENIKGDVAFQIQKQISDGVEVIVGIKHDSTFGHILLFGAGGSMAELIEDKNITLLPTDMNRIKTLVEKSKVFKLLKESNANLDKLYELIFKLGKIVEGKNEIKEIEINPVVVTQSEACAVDNKVIMQENIPMQNTLKFKTAKTLSTKLLAGKVRYFEFESSEPLDIKPGQYVSVKVSETRINCYSVSSHPSPTRFDLLVDSTPGGPGSKYFENLKPGDEMQFIGPLGNFFLKPDNDVKELLFFGTGCGVSPLKYMIETALNDQNYNQKVKLYFGLNNYEDIFLKDYFEELMMKHPNFSYEIAVNNPNPEWKGATGFITSLADKDQPNASGVAAYLCGNKFMVEDVTKLLIERGCPAQRVYTEKYGI